MHSPLMQLMLPTYITAPSSLQVYPRVSSRPPKLLEQLESILIDRLRHNDRVASTAPLLTKDRDPRLASNLSLDAHRQAFSAFIEGFTTYTPLLTRIQVRVSTLTTATLKVVCRQRVVKSHILPLFSLMMKSLYICRRILRPH